MTSKACSRSHPLSSDVTYTPDILYHYPISPIEPGKFDFYRAYLINHISHSNSELSNSSDQSVTHATTTPLKAKQRWTPFASVGSLNHSIRSNKSSINSISELEKLTMDSNISSNINCIEKGTTQSTQSSSSLTDAVINAMSKDHFNESKLNGTTYFTQDLNHLSPQSM